MAIRLDFSRSDLDVRTNLNFLRFKVSLNDEFKEIRWLLDFLF